MRYFCVLSLAVQVFIFAVLIYSCFWPSHLLMSVCILILLSWSHANHEKIREFLYFPNKNLYILFVVTFVGTGGPPKTDSNRTKGEWSVGSEGHAQGQCRREPGGVRSKGRSFAAEGLINLTKMFRMAECRWSWTWCVSTFFLLCWVLFEILHVKQITRHETEITSMELVPLMIVVQVSSDQQGKDPQCWGINSG